MANKPITVPLRPVKLDDQILYYQMGTEVLQIWQRMSVLELGVATTGLVADRLRKDEQAWDALGLGHPKQIEENPAQHARGVGDIELKYEGDQRLSFSLKTSGLGNLKTLLQAYRGACRDYENHFLGVPK